MTDPLIRRDSVLLVAGGSGGVGLEVCAQAAEAGARVVVHGSREESCAAAIERLRARVPDGDFAPLPFRLGEPGSATAFVDAAAAFAGHLDAIIYCATVGGARVVGPLRKTVPQDYGPFLATGVATFQEAVFAALPYLVETKGAIVAFASDSGLHAAPRQSLIGAHMAAIMAFVRNIGLEIAREGVRINCISPSFIAETPIFERFASAPDGRAERAAERAGLGLPTPRDIAPLALFLSGPASSKITGQIVSINGGLSA